MYLTGTEKKHLFSPRFPSAYNRAAYIFWLVRRVTCGCEWRRWSSAGWPGVVNIEKLMDELFSKSLLRLYQTEINQCEQTESLFSYSWEKQMWNYARLRVLAEVPGRSSSESPSEIKSELSVVFRHLTARLIKKSAIEAAESRDSRRFLCAAWREPDAMVHYVRHPQISPSWVAAFRKKMANYAEPESLVIKLHAR